MATITVKTQTGADAGSLAVAPAVFEAEQNAVLVREAYNAFRTNQRQGTHSTKTRGFVSGGGRKPWKQKHTGNARQGSIRAPQWRHGAIIFGPLPKKYHEAVPRKKRQGAFRALLSAKLAAGEVIVVDALDFGASPKTKSVLALRKAVGAKGRTLIVTKDKNVALVRAAANLGSSTQDPTQVQVLDAATIFDLLVADTLILTKDAFAALQERLA